METQLPEQRPAAVVSARRRLAVLLCLEAMAVCALALWLALRLLRR